MPTDDEVSEIFSALTKLESGFLSLDNQEADEATRGIVHDLFRTAHNLKSRFSIAGLPEASTLVHEMEATLDGMRSLRVAYNRGLGDALLTALDCLKEAAAGVEGWETKIPDAVTRLRAAVVPVEGKPSLPDLDSIMGLDEGERIRALAAHDEGFKLFVLEKAVSPTLTDGELEALPINQSVGKLGTVLCRRRLGDATSTVLRLLFASHLGTAEIEMQVFDAFIEVSTPAAVPVKMDRIPVSSAEVPAPLPASGTLPKNLPRILIIDDEAVSLFLLQSWLAVFGLIDTATGGMEALEKFDRALESHPYDLVFLDIIMPDLSGSEVLAEMRRLEKGRGILLDEGARIAMCTAISDYESISASFRHDCDFYVVKPFSRDRVDEVMLKLGYRPTHIDAFPGRRDQ